MNSLDFFLKKNGKSDFPGHQWFVFNVLELIVFTNNIA